MAESNGNGNGARMEKAAESALMQTISRWFIVVGIPAIAVLSGYIGTGFVAELRGIGTEVRDLSKEFRGEFKDNVSRVNGLDVRLTGVERDVEHLKAKP